MNKEEILDVLSAIGYQIGEANLSEYQLDERVSQFEDLLKAKEETKTEIKYLSEKLTSDANYPQRTPYLYDESTIFYLEDRLEAREKEEKDNLDSIKEYQRLIDEAHKKIKHHEVIIAIAERKYSEEVMEKGPDLRDASEEEFEELSAVLREKQERINLYKDNLVNINEDLIDYEAKLSELLAKTDELRKSREEAELELELYSRIISSRTPVDQMAKYRDKEKLSAAEERLAEFERIETRITYDHEKKLAEMIEGYKNGTISHEELLERLTEFKSYLSEEFVAENVEGTYSSEEYSSNTIAQEKLEREISELEAKLANDDNYLVSPFVIERNERNIVRVERNIQSIDKQINGFTEENENLQQDIATANEMIEELEKEIEECQRQIRKHGSDIDPEVEKLLKAKISSCNADIAYLENTRLEATRIIEHNSIELENLVSKQERFRIVSERMQSSLSRKNSTDLAARRLDEVELTKKKSALEALKRRGLISNISIIENIDKILGGQLQEEVEAPVEDAPDVPAPDEPVEDNADEPIIPEEEKVEPTLEDLENKFGMDPIKLGDTRRWRAKYSGKENLELAKKAKNKGFLQKLKNFFKTILKVVSYVLSYVGALITAHPIKKAKASNEFMRRVQENPEKYKNAGPKEVERELEEIAKEQQPVVEETKEVPEASFEETNNEKVVIPTNDGETISVDVSGSEEELNETQTLEGEDLEATVVEENSVTEEANVPVEETTIEEAAPNLEVQGQIESIEQFLETVEDEELDIPAEAMDEENSIEPVGDSSAEQTEEAEITVEEPEVSVEQAEEAEITVEEPEVSVEQAEEAEITVEEPEVSVEQAEKPTLTSRLSKLSEEEINDIIAQISSEMAYEVESNEIEEEVRKLK